MFVIAEIGSCFKTLADCLHSINEAIACNASAIKFQLFSHRDLFGYGSNDTQLKREWLPALKQACGGKIEFMCTAFNPRDLKLIDKFVDRHKIASSDMDYMELLTVARETGKEILLSTGGHEWGEIEKVYRMLDCNRVTLLYCESAYPCNFVDLSKGLQLRQLSLKIGLSDHSREVYSTAQLARLLGYDVVEKHVNFCGIDGPDSPHSLDGDEFREFVKATRSSSRSEDFLSNGEADMVLRHNRRCIAIKDIPKGARLEYNVNYGCYRSKVDDAHGLIARKAKEINGLTTDCHIKRGEAIATDMVNDYSNIIQLRQTL